MGEAILLRTLTLKSILWFGKYNMCSIKHVIDIGQKNYLRNMYFTMNGISFNEEVLIELNIIVPYKNIDYRIKKPGIDIELYDKLIEEFNDYYSKKCNIIAKKIVSSRIRKIGIALIKQSKERDLIRYSKANLMRKNHGH